MAERCVLLLQGPSSFFFSRLGDALEARGARVLRLHLAPGDALFWRRGGGRSYRGRFEDWPEFAARFMAREGVSDLVLLGDNRPLHRPAVDRAKAMGVRVHHVELGYVRPDWLTVEPDGGGAGAPFPQDWETLEALAARGEIPEETRLYRASFAAYAAMDIAWNLTNLALSWATHPGYRRHQTWHPLAEYGGFLWKMSRARRDRAHAARVWEDWRQGDAPLFLLPLQLRTDFQIRAHGPDPDLRETAKAVVRSFALHAPPAARLLVKEHPVDNGLTPWRRLLRETAARHGAEDRVEVVDGGDLGAMLDRASGLVTVNSTVGLSALRRGLPVKTLGRAIFDREGLVDPQPLAGFWSAPKPPAPGRAETFLKALAWTSLVRGNFDGEGVAEGAANLAERILAPRRHPDPQA